MQEFEFLSDIRELGACLSVGEPEQEKRCYALLVLIVLLIT